MKRPKKGGKKRIFIKRVGTEKGPGFSVVGAGARCTVEL